MAHLLKSNCPACGAPITIPVGVDRLNCANCGSAIIVEFGEGYYTLKSAEKIAQAIEQTGSVTRDAIRENTNATKSELQRLQFSQEQVATQMQLSNTRAEIRLLERSPKTKRSAAQLLALHQMEFQTMEQIRLLQKKVSAPAAKDFKANLSLAEWEKSWVLEEIQALEASNQPKMKQIRKGLYDRVAELSETILQIKIKELKSHCFSFQLQDPLPADDLGIRNLLAMIVADEQKLRDHRHTPEGKILRRALSERRQRLEKILKNNQQVRSTPIDNRTEKSSHPGIFAGLAAGTAGLIAGSAAPVNKKQDNAASLGLPAGISTAEMPPALPAASLRNKGSHGTFFKGLLLGFLVFIGIVVIGFILFGLLFSGEQNVNNISVGFLVFCIAIGFGVGSYVFLRHAAPKTTIHLSEKMSDIVIPPKKGAIGVRNLAGVKTMLAIITCLSVYLIILSLAMILTPLSAGVGTAIALIGLVLGPLSARFVVKRTSITLSDETE